MDLKSPCRFESGRRYGLKALTICRQGFFYVVKKTEFLQILIPVIVLPNPIGLHYISGDAAYVSR
jgi:hypothetical protein